MVVVVHVCVLVLVGKCEEESDEVMVRITCGGAERRDCGGWTWRLPHPHTQEAQVIMLCVPL